jgi:hypothetical protein
MRGETSTLGEDDQSMELEFGEEIITFDSPIHAYDPTDTALAMAGGSSSSGSNQQAGVRKRKSIKSETSIEVVGPMEVDGSVKSMGAVTFTGDFSVRDRIEAYGDIDVNGSLTCRYDRPRISSSTCCITPANIHVQWHKHTDCYCSSKVKSFGSLQVNGNALCT